MECGHPGTLDEVSKSFQETIKVAQKPEDTLQLVNVRPRCGFDTFVTESTQHVYE